MDILQAVALGILQGMAEFLPISSSGHLVLLRLIFGYDEPALVFDAALHLGSLAAVFIYFKNDILALARRPFQKLTYQLIIASLPAAAVGFLFKDRLENLFSGGPLLAAGFALTGLFLLFADSAANLRRTPTP